jgi:hypothetical protein
VSPSEPPAEPWDHLLRRGWPALSEVDVDGWVARLSGGVTQRANSVAPLAAPPDLGAAMAAVERLYAGHGLPAIFQLGRSVCPADLDAVLVRRGYTYGSPTTVMAAPVADVLAALTGSAGGEPARVEVAGEPSAPGTTTGRARQTADRNRSSTSAPKRRPATGTRSSTPWAISRWSKPSGSHSGAKP